VGYVIQTDNNRSTKGTLDTNPEGRRGFGRFLGERNWKSVALNKKSGRKFEEG
jgi:hypothetical protein